MNWEIMKVRSGEENKYLVDGWEPFGAVSHQGSYRFQNTGENRMQTQLTNIDYIYLRRKVRTRLLR